MGRTASEEVTLQVLKTKCIYSFMVLRHVL